MDGRLILEALPIESYVPADVMRMVDDLSYFEEHPRYRRLTQPRYPLTAAAPPFRPASWRAQSIAAPAPPMQTTSRHSARSARIAALPDAPFDEAPAPRTPAIPPALARQLTTVGVVDPAELYRQLSRFLTPSGPRLNGEGTQEQVQGITHTIRVSERLHFVYMTLLVAGFVIGPSGESVRSVMSASNTCIYSCTDVIRGKKCRVFFIEGKQPCVQIALRIIKGAVNHYKELAEGKYEGLLVEKTQSVQGIEFFYHPPPRSQVPFAAGLRMEKAEKSKHASKRERGGQRQKPVPVSGRGSLATAPPAPRADFGNRQKSAVMHERLRFLPLM